MTPLIAGLVAELMAGLMAGLDPELLDIFAPWLTGIGINAVLMAIAWFAPKKLLTPAGLVHAGILGVILWGSLGLRGYLLMLIYFAVGSAVTRVGMAQKEAAGIAEKRSGARGPENVWGSALVAAVCALSIYAINSFQGLWVQPTTELLLLGYVASISTKLSDTCASEVGKAYGKHTFLITNLQPAARGTEGAVSLEGTLAGIFGSAVLATTGWALGLIYPVDIAICMVAAFIATNLESVIGATLQTQIDWLTNEVVNIINTLIGAVTAVLIAVVTLFSLIALRA